MNYEKIGDFIGTKRREKGLTQKELAAKLKITDKAISKWERGLGCPDVSLLEPLSKILDVSILEILKGREIKEELGNINDYIIETVNYSKYKEDKKIKNIILNILAIIIIVIVGFLSILNIYHLFYLNKLETYNFTEKTEQDINNNLTKIKENINIIENMETKIEENEHLLNSVKEQYESLKNNPLATYKGINKFNIYDLYVIDEHYYSQMDLIKCYEILAQYDQSFEQYKNHYITTFMLKTYTGESLFKEAFNAYKYQIIVNDEFETNYKVQARVSNYLFNLEELLFLTNSIIEVGDINA